jgi:hypothetical protein
MATIQFENRSSVMPSTIEVPISVQETDSTVSLDDLLDTLKVTYTVTNCLRCGLIATAPELARPVVRELALA